LLRTEFGEGHVAPLFLVGVFPEGPLSAEAIAAQHRLGRVLKDDPRVARVRGIASVDDRITLPQYQLLYRDAPAIGDPYVRAIAGTLARGNTSVMIVEPSVASISPEVGELVAAIREYRDAEDLDLLVGGGGAGLTDFVDRLYTDFPKAVAIILSVTFVVLAILFRSIVLPLKAVLLNVLSLLASFGALVLVFQDGWLSTVLRFEPLGFIEATLPIILFALLFGLSMDYEVFLLSRVKEAYDEGHSNTDSVAIGLERSGSVITSAALVVIVVCLAFVTADIVLIKAVGLGAAIAVFVDAAIVRSLLVPATMRLLGRWNWWAPRWMPGTHRGLR
jgi:RND superfamily putative drug exporter